MREMTTCPQNQWIADQFKAAVDRMVVFEAVKLSHPDYFGPLKTRRKLERDLLEMSIPAGNA
mgnify:CR=1 FL=1